MNLRALMEEVSGAAEELLPFVTAAAVFMGTGALVAVLAAAAAGTGAALAVMDAASTATLIIGAAAYAVVLAAALRSIATWSGRRGEETGTGAEAWEPPEGEQGGSSYNQPHDAEHY